MRMRKRAVEGDKEERDGEVNGGDERRRKVKGRRKIMKEM